MTFKQSIKSQLLTYDNLVLTAPTFYHKAECLALLIPVLALII